jgi:L-ribulose-5-phosphate 3-epimerase
MTLSRRALLATTPLSLLSAAPAQTASPTRRQPLAVSTYSFWHFRTERYSIEKVIQHAADIGFDGVEILHRQMVDESPAYVTRLKRMAFERGLALPMLSIHQDFVFPEQAERDKNITHTVKCVELAARLGIPCVRLNSGRWKTIKSFDDLMKVKGNEPALPGFNEQNAIDWCIDSIRKCLPVCEREGITLALENHWGLTTNIDTLLKIHDAVSSPWLGINLDTGNYPGEPYPGIAKLAPKATIVQAKTYYGGGEWYTLDLDYKRIAGILKQAGFKGWVSLEMEGKADPLGAVQKSYDQLRAAFA